MADRAVGAGDFDPVLSHAGNVVDELAAARDQLDAVAAQPSAMSSDWAVANVLTRSLISGSEILDCSKSSEYPRLGLAAARYAHPWRR